MEGVKTTMATTTTNLGLTKPIGTEKALVSVINGNMDIIDNKVGAIPQNESVQSQITALNNQKANYISSFSVNTSDSETDNISAGNTATYTIKHDGIYRIYIQTNTNSSTGQSCTVTSGGNAILAMRTNGIQYQNAQIIAPLKAGIVLTVNAPSGSAVQYQITRYTEA